MKKRLVAIIVSLITIITAAGGFGGITVYAETEEENPFKDYSIMNLETPSDFYTTANPTGTDENTPILLMQQSELLKFVQYNCSSDNSCSEYYVYDDIKNTDGVMFADPYVHNSARMNGNYALFGLNFVQTVSFDPSKSGRDDHVAFVGVDEDKNVQLVIYNAKDDKWSDAYEIGTMKSWVTNGTNNYAMEPHLSITAGDYDGDYNDTVVVFATVDEQSCEYLYEFKVNSTNNGITITKKAVPRTV